MQQSRQLQELLSWTGLQAVLYLFGGLLFLFVGSLSSILEALVVTEQERTQLRSIGGIVRANVDQFLGSLEGQDGSATLATLVFWSAAGAFLYMFFWAGVNAVRDFLNNSTVASTFVHSQSFDKSNHWYEYASRTAFRIFAIVLMIGYTFLVSQLLVPIFLQFFDVGISRLSEPAGIGMLLLAVIGSFFAIHMYSVMLRLIVMRTRVFKADTQ
jgi:hypothetical protein